MAIIGDLFNSKYILLDYIYQNATVKEDAYVLYHTIDEMVEHLPFQRRKVFNLLNTLEAEGFLEKYKYNRRKYAFTKEGLEIYARLSTLVKELSSSEEALV